ncbi:MAG: hypothetical protein RL222_1967 [Bacteroidota bacterium]
MQLHPIIAGNYYFYVHYIPVLYKSAFLKKNISAILILFLVVFTGMGKGTLYQSFFDYRNVNTATFLTMEGWNNEQKHVLTILKHSFELKDIVSTPRDTAFRWNGMKGQKSLYSKDSLILFFLRPDDAVQRPCILLTHGNAAKYRSSWSEYMHFLCIDLVMRGYAVAYYENPSSQDAGMININMPEQQVQLLSRPRNAFYRGFQAAVAAQQYVIAHRESLQVDTSQLMAGGYSFGAFCSLMLGSADTTRNFRDTLFDAQGNYTANARYDIPYTKNIRRVFSIGGGLPKDDTVFYNSSRMGQFIDNGDALQLLFLHGRTDNFISFDLTKVGESAEDTLYFFAEGPRAIQNQLREKNIPLATRTFVNCRGGHQFVTSVCSYDNPYCIEQFQWPYLLKPPDSPLSDTNTYFKDAYRDTLLHYVSYMLTQTDDMGFVIGDFLREAVLQAPGLFGNQYYFIEPENAYSYNTPQGHYRVKELDCEGNSIPVSIREDKSSSDAAVKIFPNPATDILYLQSEDAMEKISLYTITGQWLQDFHPDGNIASLPVDDLPAGTYLCVITRKNGITVRPWQKFR